MSNKETMKEGAKCFAKLDKFAGQDFRRWQKKMHFMLTNLKVVYVMSTPMPEAVEIETLEQTRRRMKWENDDYICRGHILNGMSDSLFDVYQNFESVRNCGIPLKPNIWQKMPLARNFLLVTLLTIKWLIRGLSWNNTTSC